MIKKDNSEKIEQLQHAIDAADCVIIGAGAGLSTAAGFTYTGSGLKLIFRTLQKNRDLVICTAEDFILIKR